MEKNKKVMLSIIGFAIMLISLVGVTVAFFNYTRTGAENTIGTGRIAFNSSQTGAIELTNVFPITSTEASNANLDTVTVTITGDTTYVDGEEFLVSLVDVTNTINNKQVPMNYIATYVANTGGTIGTSSNDYWNARESKNATIYQLNATGAIEEDAQVLMGYIDNGATGINGTLTIKAYVDADRIAITDTPDENTDWQRGRTVFTTTEWNSFQGTPLSFKIKVVSQEGIWVEDPTIPIIDSCVGCKFIYTMNEYFYSANNYASAPLSTLATFANNNDTLEDDYRKVMANSGNNYFLGFKFDESGNVTNAYACGVLGANTNNVTPFCIEGALSDDYGGNSTTRETIYNSNYSVLNTLYGNDDDDESYCDVNGTIIVCSGSVGADAFSDGLVSTDYNAAPCEVHYDGNAYCFIY